MKIIVKNPTLRGGIWYNPSATPQTVPDDVGIDLIRNHAAVEYHTKVNEPTEKKPLSVSPAGPASQKKTAKPRKRPKTT